MNAVSLVALAVVVSGVVGTTCSRDASPPRHEVTAAPAGPLLPALVGYDIRRIRPQADPLEDTFARLEKTARSEGMRVALLFSADWCDSCKRLELEFGNSHPAGTIDDVRILQFVEEDWEAATRMDEVYDLRRRYYPRLDNYPVMLLLDGDGHLIEEMADASKRLEAAGEDPSMVNWFASSRDAARSGAADAIVSESGG